jgi:hypothetical protein
MNQLLNLCGKENVTQDLNDVITISFIQNATRSRCGDYEVVNL